MSRKIRRRLGAFLFALGLCVLGFTIFGAVSELVADESFEGGLEPLLAIWWLLVPVGAMLTVIGASMVFSRANKAAPAQPPPSPT